MAERSEGPFIKQEMLEFLLSVFVATEASLWLRLLEPFVLVVVGYFSQGVWRLEISSVGNSKWELRPFLTAQQSVHLPAAEGREQARIFIS